MNRHHASRRRRTTNVLATARSRNFGFTVKGVNPGAPLVIQVGNLPRVVRKAELLSSQPETRFTVLKKLTKGDKHYYFVV